MAIVGIVAVGETIVIISGGFDLSIGSVMAASGMTSAYPARLGRAAAGSRSRCSILLGIGDRRS